MNIPKAPLGDTGLQCSRLGLGTVKFGRNQGVKYPTSFDLPDDRHLANLLAAAKDLGINVLDTAPAYGISEARLGPLLKGQRSDWVLSSKTGEEFENGESYFDFSRKHTRLSVERSLKRLNTDYLDIVMVHSNGEDSHILQHTEVVSTLFELRREGKIRAIGFSGKTTEGGLLALQDMDMAMVTYNLNESDEGPVIDYAARHQKGIYIKKALGSGHAAKSESEDPVLSSFQHILARQGVTSIIVGTLSADHLRQNAASLRKALASREA